MPAHMDRNTPSADANTLHAPLTPHIHEAVESDTRPSSRIPSGKQQPNNSDTGAKGYMADPSPLGPRFFGNLMFVLSGDTVQTWPASNLATTTAFTFDSYGDVLAPVWDGNNTSDGAQAGYNYRSEVFEAIVATKILRHRPGKMELSPKSQNSEILEAAGKLGVVNLHNTIGVLTPSARSEEGYTPPLGESVHWP